MSSRAVRKVIGQGAVWTIIIVGTLLVLYTGRAAWHTFSKERDVAKDELNIEGAYEELVSRKNALVESNKKLDSERGIEEEIRGRFPVARPGEEVITIVDPKNKVTEPSVEEAKGFLGGFTDWLSF